MARPAKKRGKVLKGTIQSFRYLNIQWIGKGDVQTLTDADERGRHNIPPSELMMGLYLNELLLLLTNQHAPMPDLFSAYKYTLHKLGDPIINQQIMMRFELYFLESLGHSLNLQESGNDPDDINPELRYKFIPSQGLAEIDNDKMVRSDEMIISGELLLALQNIQSMTESQWQALRQFLDIVFRAIAPRRINTRRLLTLSL